MPRYIALLSLSMLVSTPALAGTDHDAEFWTSLSASGSIRGPLLAQGEAIFRFSTDEDRLYQKQLRGSLGYELSDRVTVFAGYTRVFNPEDGPDGGEDRLHQQIGLSLGEMLGGRFSSRTRLEQRMVKGGDDTGLRLRQQLRYGRPIGDDLSLQLSGEAFFALNDTDWGARSGFERLRSAIALRQPIVPKTELEVGYLNQFNRRRRGPDVIDHALMLNLSYAF